MDSGFLTPVVTAIDARNNTITANASMPITEDNHMILWGHEESTMKNDTAVGEAAFQDMSAIKNPITVETLANEMHTSAFKTDAAATYDKEGYRVVTNKWLDIQAKEEDRSKSKGNENSVGEHDKDLINGGIDIPSEKNHGSPESEEIYMFENRVQSLVCFSCPLLNSWNEEGGDEFDFRQAATSESSTEEKEEADAPSDSSTDDPRSSTEKSHSQRVRIPLCNLFAKDSISVSDLEERGASTEECDPLVKSIPDTGICSTPKPLATSKVNTHKQKLRSFFRYCICLPTVR